MGETGSTEEAERTAELALRLGYRHIDTVCLNIAGLPSNFTFTTGRKVRYAIHITE